MIRNRSNLITLFYYSKIPHFYNTYATLLIIIRRKFIWFRIYKVVWLIYWYFWKNWLLIIQKYKQKLIHILFNFYCIDNYNYFYFYNTNQYLLINIPYFLLFLYYNNFNIFIIHYNSTIFINILNNSIKLTVLNQIFNNFLILKYLRLNLFQVIVSNLIFYYVKNDLNFLFYCTYWQKIKYEFLLLSSYNNIDQINWFNIILYYYTIIYQYIIYLILHFICV